MADRPSDHSAARSTTARGTTARNPTVRSRTVAFAVLLGGGLLGLLLASQAWWTLPSAPAISGNQASATLAGVLAGAAVAGGALALLLRRTGRRILGGLLAVIGVGMVLTGWAARTPPVTTTPFDAGAPSATGAQFAYAGTGLLVAVGGVLLLLRAHRWPARADRFSRLDRAAVRAEDDAGEVWKALDQGFDPTSPDPSGPQEPGRSSGQKPYDR